MGYILGIDTGGTYTDACLLEIESIMQGKIVGYGKALTDPYNLIQSIEQVLLKLESNSPPLDWTQIKQVSLSTTLATNSIVEGKGCRVGLIMIGRSFSKPTPATYVYEIKGGHSITGDPLAELIPAEMEKAWDYLKDKTDAYAIAGYMSIRNPEHEIVVRDFLANKTNKPIVCAYQLSNKLGLYERSITAVLNAKILPLIVDLLDAAEIVFASRSIKAPIMVVKGDGTLFSLKQAREYPVETVQSGPAASIIGACYLSGKNVATVIDMGGTTMDIALADGNLFAENHDGVTIGGWRTRVKTVHSDSVGLGGDSHIKINNTEITFGPRRAIPISRAASEYPQIISELEFIGRQNIYSRRYLQDFFIVSSRTENENLSSSELEIINALIKHPLSLRQLSEKLNKPPGLLPFSRLEEIGILQRISFTPTDLLHVRGEINFWNSNAPYLFLKILSRQLKKSVEELSSAIYDEFVIRISREILSRLIDCELSVQDVAKTEVGKKLLERLLENRQETELTWKLCLKKPLLAVGAPVKAFFPTVARKLKVSLVIPPFMQIANAVGASIAPVVKQAVVLVRPYNDVFSVHSPLGKKEFSNLEDAITGAIEMATTEIKQYFSQLNIENPEIEIETKENFFKGPEGSELPEKLLLDASIKVQGKGFPIAEFSRLQIK